MSRIVMSSAYEIISGTGYCLSARIIGDAAPNSIISGRVCRGTAGGIIISAADRIDSRAGVRAERTVDRIEISAGNGIDVFIAAGIGRNGIDIPAAYRTGIPAVDSM